MFTKEHYQSSFVSDIKKCKAVKLEQSNTSWLSLAFQTHTIMHWWTVRKTSLWSMLLRRALARNTVSADWLLIRRDTDSSKRPKELGKQFNSIRLISL